MTDGVDLLYLDLLKKCLTRTLFDENFSTIPMNNKTAIRRLRSAGYATVQSLLSRFDLSLVHMRRPVGETMIGMGALENLEMCAKSVINDRIPGDLCETGVWRGGACIFMRAILKVYDDTTRKVWVCDSFEGLPEPDEAHYPADKGSRLWQQSLAVSLDQVKRNFQKYNLLDDQVRFVKGFFSDTMPIVPIDRLAVLRLDGDMYESTIVVLQNLYPKLSSGGYVIFDDYGMIPACNKAVEDYRRDSMVKEPLEFIGFIDGNPLGAYWRKA